MLSFELTTAEAIYILSLVKKDHKTKDFQIGLVNFNGEFGKAEILTEQKQLAQSLIVKLKTPKYIDDDK